MSDDHEKSLPIAAVDVPSCTVSRIVSSSIESSRMVGVNHRQTEPASPVERSTTPPLNVTMQQQTPSLTRMNATLTLENPLSEKDNRGSLSSVQASVTWVDNTSSDRPMNGPTVTETATKATPSSLTATATVDIHRNEFRLFFLNRLGEPFQQTAILPVPADRRTNMYQTLIEQCRQMSLCDGVSHLVMEMKQLHDKITSAMHLQRHVDVGPSASNMLGIVSACIGMVDRGLQLPSTTKEGLTQPGQVHYDNDQRAAGAWSPSTPTKSSHQNPASDANGALRVRVSWVTSITMYRLASLGHPRLWLSLFLAPEHANVLDRMARIVGYLVILKKLSAVASSCKHDPTESVLTKEADEDDHSLENYDTYISTNKNKSSMSSSSERPPILAPATTSHSLTRPSLQHPTKCRDSKTSSTNHGHSNTSLMTMRNRLNVQVAPYRDRGVPAFIAPLHTNAGQDFPSSSGL